MLLDFRRVLFLSFPPAHDDGIACRRPIHRELVATVLGSLPAPARTWIVAANSLHGLPGSLRARGRVAALHCTNNRASFASHRRGAPPVRSSLEHDILKGQTIPD